MGITRDLFGKFFKIIPGGIFGIISGLTGLICDIIAILLYPGYSIFQDMVSSLGVGPGGHFFNYGLIFSGISGAIFYLYVGLSFYNEDSSIKLVKSAIIISIISSLLMASIGIYPAIQEEPLIIISHYFTTLLTILTGIIFYTMFGYLIIKSSQYSSYLAIIACIPTFIMIIILIFIITPFTQALVPFTEWLMVFSVIVFALITASYTLYKKI